MESVRARHGIQGDCPAAGPHGPSDALSSRAALAIPGRGDSKASGPAARGRGRRQARAAGLRCGRRPPEGTGSAAGRCPPGLPGCKGEASSQSARAWDERKAAPPPPAVPTRGLRRGAGRSQRSATFSGSAHARRGRAAAVRCGRGPPLPGPAGPAPGVHGARTTAGGPAAQATRTPSPGAERAGGRIPEVPAAPEAHGSEGTCKVTPWRSRPALTGRPPARSRELPTPPGRLVGFRGPAGTAARAQHVA